MHWHDEPGGAGFWAITRYRDVKAVGRDAATFSSVPTTMISDQAAAMDLGDEHQMMLTADAPRHTQLRKLVAAEFIPRAAKAMRPRIEALATTIVDGVAAAGSCDLVTDVAGLMPSYVIADMLGIPHQDGVALYELTEAIHAAPESQAAGAGMSAILEMFNYARGVWEDRREHPADDLASLIAHAALDDRDLDLIDFNLFFLLLIDAGGDTTRNLVAGGLDALLAHPDQLAWLTADLDARLRPRSRSCCGGSARSSTCAARRRATTSSRRGDRRGRQGRHVLRLGQPRRGGVRPHRRPLDLSRAPNDHVAFGGEDRTSASAPTSPASRSTCCCATSRNSPTCVDGRHRAVAVDLISPEHLRSPTPRPLSSERHDGHRGGVRVRG